VNLSMTKLTFHIINDDPCRYFIIFIKGGIQIYAFASGFIKDNSFMKILTFLHILLF